MAVIGAKTRFDLAALYRPIHPPSTTMTCPLRGLLKILQPIGIAVRASTDTLAVTTRGAQCVDLYPGKSSRKHGSTGYRRCRRGIPAHSGSCVQGRVAHDRAPSINAREKLTRARIERARALLLSTGEPVETVAAQTGFCHGAHLHRAFKERFGITPRAFRWVNK
jgi:AraC-like DNA-binding protein